MHWSWPFAVQCLQPGVQKPLSTACPRCGAGVPTPRCALVSLRAGLCVNLCFAACKLYAGIRFRSPWFGAAAVYYTVLSTMRFAVLRGVRNAPPAGPSAAPVRQMRGLRVYRRCGVLMFALNLAMTAIAAQMVW